MSEEKGIVIQGSALALFLAFALVTAVAAAVGFGFGLYSAVVKAPVYTIGTFNAGEDNFVPSNMPLEQVNQPDQQRRKGQNVKR